jgi:hypothetical protein
MSVPFSSTTYGGADPLTTVGSLTDTSITSLADGEVLKYDATSAKWVNGTAGGAGPEPYFSGWLNVAITQAAAYAVPNQTDAVRFPGGVPFNPGVYYFPAKISSNYVFTSAAYGTSSGAQAHYFNVIDPQAFMIFPVIGTYKVHVQLRSDYNASHVTASFCDMTSSTAASNAGQILDVLYASRKESVSGSYNNNDLDMEIIITTTVANQHLYLLWRTLSGSGWTPGDANYLFSPNHTTNTRVHVWRMM